MTNGKKILYFSTLVVVFLFFLFLGLFKAKGFLMPFVTAINLSLVILPLAQKLEGWKMSRAPMSEDTIDAFCDHVAKELPPKFPMDGKTVATGVFEVIWTELDVGETAKVIDRLPLPLKTLWPRIARRA